MISKHLENGLGAFSSAIRCSTGNTKPIEFWEMRAVTSTLLDFDTKTAGHSCTIVPVARIEMKSTEFQKLANEGISLPLRTCGLEVVQYQRGIIMNIYLMIIVFS
jgi:hypothetical protein